MQNLSVKRRRGAQPGNKNALKHGFYSPGLRPIEETDLETIAGAVDLGDEISMLRVIMRRVFEAAGEEDVMLSDLAGVLGTLGAAATRLAGLMRIQKVLAGGGSDVAEALSQALRDVTNEFGKDGNGKARKI